VDRDEQLQWERKNARWAAVAAALSAILTIGAALYARSKVPGSADDDAIDKIQLVHAHKTDLLVATGLTGIGTALLSLPLYYLFRATRFRRPQLPGGLRYVVLGAPALAGVALFIHQIQSNQIADKYVAKLPLSVQIAEDMIGDEVGGGAVAVVGGIATAAALGLAFMFVMISLNAMRAGLLSRFMGIMGIIVGVLIVIPLQGDLPIIQVFFLGALAALFLDYWPQGRGPAWASATEIPWPSAAEKRDALGLGGGGPRGRVREEAADDVEPDDDHLDDSAPASAPQHTREAARPRASAQHPSSKKRKRKRRG
jgi:hypothetical protein